MKYGAMPVGYCALRPCNLRIKVAMNYFLRKRFYLIFVFFIALVTCYLVWNIDQEGECTKPTNFFECWGILFNFQNDFVRLPPDTSLIEQFQKNKKLLGAQMENKTEPFHGIIKFMDSGEQYIINSPYKMSDKSNVYMFYVAGTMFIKGLDATSKKEWPWVIRAKGYLYFEQNENTSYNEIISVLSQYGTYRHNLFRLVDQLDHDWPEDWTLGECLLRHIEGGWYLYLCKQVNGG